MELTLEYRFVDEWDENTDIAWRARGRRRLNVAIRAYNAWQRDGFKPAERQRTLATIIEARQILDDVDGGSDWVEELDRMLEFVRAIPDASLDDRLLECYSILRDIRQHAHYGQYECDGEFSKNSSLSYIESLAADFLKENK